MSPDRRTTLETGAAAALREALEALDVRCTVQARERLAVLVPADEQSARRLADPAVRREVVARATAAGFTHVAVELDPPGARATLPRD